MKNLKGTLVVGAMILAIGATPLTVFADSQYKTPAEAVAGITGQEVETVMEQRQETNKTYGTIAAEAGKLDEFKAANLEMKKDNLKAQVAAGKMTQEKADEIIKALEENQANCNGTGTSQIGRRMGAKFGSNGTALGNCGEERGKGMGRGATKGGRGNGVGGQRLQDGSCGATTTN